MTSYRVLQGPVPFGIAHRGGAWEQPENSRRAFQHAVDLGYTFLETDVRATADGVAVVFHDAHLDRTTGVEGLIRELPLSEVAKAKIHGREPILTLDELLESWPDTRFNLDVKAANAIAPFVDTVRKHKAWERICVASFSHTRLQMVRKLAGPRLATSLSPRELARLRMHSLGWRKSWANPGVGCAQVPVKVGKRTFCDDRFISAAHAAGLQVHVWTIDDEAEMNRLFDLGIDAIMTDRPARLLNVLAERS